MRKLLAVLLTLMMVMSLFTACGGEDDKESNPDKTSTVVDNEDDNVKEDTDEKDTEKTEGQSADLLSAPATVLETDTLKIKFDMVKSDGTRLSGTIAVEDNVSPALLYYQIGDEEAIYSLADDGTISKAIGGGSFTEDTESSQETLKSETDTIIDLLSNSGWKFTEKHPDLKYRPIEAPTSGNAIVYGGADSTWYELVKGESVVGYIAVDNQTGVFNYAQSSEYYFATILAETENISIY